MLLLPTSRARRRPVPALVAVLAVLTVAVTAAGLVRPALADEVTGRPGSAWTVAGHGWGHGRGMSQVGAQGAAASGRSADDILAFYYPGTAAGSIPLDHVFVQLSGDVGLTGAPSSSVELAAGQSLTATDLATNRTVVLPTAPDRWRVVPDATTSTLKVQQRVSGSWSDYAFSGSSTVAGPVQFSVGSGYLRRYYPGGGWREYRGLMWAVSKGPGAIAAESVVWNQEYLEAVVPSELGSSSRLTAAQNDQALQAQAVAARSYMDNRRSSNRRQGLPYDICDDTRCQVYGGVAVSTDGSTSRPVEAAAASAAVDATDGKVRTYGGSSALTEFSASNGGWSVAGSLPYEVAQADPYDGVTGSASHSWTATLRPADLERAFPAVGHLTAVDVVSRDGHGEWGGRVGTVQLRGTDSSGRATSVSTTGAGVVGAHSWPGSSDGLRSAWFDLGAPPSGTLDGTDGVDGGLSARGWTYDPDSPTTALATHVYVDGAGAAVVQASESRPDVAAAFPVAGPAHGYSAAVFAPPGDHTSCTYGIDVGPLPAGNTTLGCRRVTVPGSHDPIGFLDGAEPASGGLHVHGWAIDAETQAPIRVHVYVDGSAVAGLTASASRPDVARVHPLLGAAHGYDAVLPVGPGRHHVCAYGINTGPGGNALLTCVDTS